MSLAAKATVSALLAGSDIEATDAGPLSQARNGDESCWSACEAVVAGLTYPAARTSSHCAQG